MPEEGDQNGKESIPTTLRMFRLVEEIAQRGQPVAPSELAAMLGLAKPSVHRLLAMAEREGLLQRDLDGRSFGPGNRLRRLAANTLSSQRVRTERLLIMKSLAQTAGETVNLAAPGRMGMVYLDRVETHWPLRIQLAIGTQVPFHCTASGKMYLSSLKPERLRRYLTSADLKRYSDKTLTDPEAITQDLRETRARGYATDDQEFMDGMVAMAVGICDDRGRLLTTLSIHCPIQRKSLKDLLQVHPALVAARDQLEALVDQTPVSERSDAAE